MPHMGKKQEREGKRSRVKKGGGSSSLSRCPHLQKKKGGGEGGGGTLSDTSGKKTIMPGFPPLERGTLKKKGRWSVLTEEEGCTKFPKEKHLEEGEVVINEQEGEKKHKRKERRFLSPDRPPSANWEEGGQPEG